MREEIVGPSGNEEPLKGFPPYFYPKFSNLPSGGPSSPFAVPLFDVSACQPLQVEVSETEDIRTWEDLPDPSPETGGPAPEQTTPLPPETPED